MAQIFGDKLLMFHVSAVDSNSVANADDGTNLDLAAFPAKNITSIAAENNGSGLVYIYFKDGTKFEDGVAVGGSVIEIMEQSFVRLTCTSGKEAAVIEDLWATMNSVSAGPVIKFDFVTSGYSQPVSGVTAAQVRRHVTTHTIASDS